MLIMQTRTREKACIVNYSQQWISFERNEQLTVNVGHYPRLRNIFIMVNFCGNAVFLRGCVWLTSQMTNYSTDNLSEQPESLHVPGFLVCRAHGPLSI